MTRSSWLSNVYQVFQCFLERKALVEKATKKKVRTFRTDNGGEYTSSQFENYLKAEGIRHELTVHKTPQQNGVAERLNLTLVEMARSMLLNSKLPKKFWGEAILTAVYLKNRTPVKALNKTPFEVWHGKKPKVNHLRMFGSDAYAHVPRDERVKFDTKTRKCIMIGYGNVTKGYRLYDAIEGKIIYSRDVQFNEKVEECPQNTEDTAKSDYQLTVEFSEGSEIEMDHDVTQSEQVKESSLLEPRRSTRTRRQPNYYGQESSNVCEVPQSPVSYREATTGPDKRKWETAMETEMTSLRENHVWDLVKLPVGKKTVGSKWVYKVKTGADGSVQRYKARLVAQGFTQQYGIDFDETFCPVVRQESLWLLMALSVRYGLSIHQVDMTIAFLNGTLEDEVYMQQPKGFECPGKEEFVCKLNKSIYDLKQSPCFWNSTLDAFLKEMQFTQTASDPYIHYRKAGKDIMFIGVYVDDIILAAKNEKQLKQVKEDLSNKFDITDLGELKYFLGIKVEQNKESGSIWIGQPAYTENLLKRLGQQDSKPTSTPVEVSSKLKPAPS